MSGHRSFQDLDSEIRSVASKIPVGREYRHYKNPNSCYEVVGYVVLEKDDTVAIEYIDPVYPTVKFARPAVSWNEEVEYQGRNVNRFSPIE